MHHQTEQLEPKGAWVVSLAFWLVLFCAACLYAGVALAPKWLHHLELKNAYVAKQMQLVRLEEQVDYLHRVADALENDPEFATELARADLRAARPGDETIPVTGRLALDATPAEFPNAPAVTLPWYGFALKILARDQAFRTATLIVVTLMVVLSFTYLHESQTAQLKSASFSVRKLAGILGRRYWKPVDPE